MIKRKLTLEERIIRLERLIREGQEDLLSMLFSGRPSQVSAALSYGIDPNEKVNGKTALMEVAMSNKYDKQPISVASLILNNKVKLANVNLRDYDGRTALHYAAESDYAKLVKLLVNHGANLNLRDADGKTALDYAKQYNNKEVEDILINAGAV